MIAENEQNGLKRITSFDDYLKNLNEIKSDTLIMFAVRDTVGACFKKSSAELIRQLGISTDLSGKHGHSFVGLLNGGKAVADNLSVTNEDVKAHAECEGLDISLSSSVYKKDDISEIKINGVNESIDFRGLNIVVYDKNNKEVIDRVCFDTHVKTNACYREREKWEIQQAINTRNIKRLQNQNEALKKQVEELKKTIDTGFGKMQMLIWQSMSVSGEKLPDVKKRFFKSIQPAQGTLRKTQQAGLILLKTFDKICRSNDIHYWISFGTLLGAVRHGGFIPWDDDTDVCIMRDQIPKLREALKDNRDFYLDEFFALRHIEPGNMNHNLQLHYREENTPYSLDIFICDYSEKMPGSLISDTKNLKKEMGAESLVLSQKTFGKMEKVSSKVYDKDFADLFDKYLKKARLLYGDEKSRNYVVWSVDNVNSKQGYGTFFPVDTIFPLEVIEFEGYSFPAPRQMEEYLNSLYDDYLSIPNDTERKHFFIAGDKLKILESILEKHKGELLDHEEKKWN